MLREANFLCLQRAPDNTYMGVHNANTRQLELMEAAGLNENDIDQFAREETRRPESVKLYTHKQFRILDFISRIQVFAVYKLLTLW